MVLATDTRTDSTELDGLGEEMEGSSMHGAWYERSREASTNPASRGCCQLWRPL